MSATSVTPQAAQFGLVGLGVTGEKLALNLAGHGYRVTLWPHTASPASRGR